MAFTYDPSTDRGKVRRNIGDKDTSNSDNQMFDDSEIDSFLDSANQDVQLATAYALRAMAADPSLRAIKYRMMSTDGFEIDKTQMAAELRESAKDWERRAEQGPVEEIDSQDYEVGLFGGDGSEYVGDPVT